MDNNGDELVDDNDEYETNDHPMSEDMYKTLSIVRGFTKINGESYSAYCAKWLSRKAVVVPKVSGLPADRFKSQLNQDR